MMALAIVYHCGLLVEHAAHNHCWHVNHLLAKRFEQIYRRSPNRDCSTSSKWKRKIQHLRSTSPACPSMRQFHWTQTGSRSEITFHWLKLLTRLDLGWRRICPCLHSGEVASTTTRRKRSSDDGLAPLLIPWAPVAHIAVVRDLPAGCV